MDPHCSSRGLRGAGVARTSCVFCSGARPLRGGCRPGPCPQDSGCPELRGCRQSHRCRTETCPGEGGRDRATAGGHWTLERFLSSRAGQGRGVGLVGGCGALVPPGCQSRGREARKPERACASLTRRPGYRCSARPPLLACGCPLPECPQRGHRNGTGLTVLLGVERHTTGKAPGTWQGYLLTSA